MNKMTDTSIDKLVDGYVEIEKTASSNPYIPHSVMKAIEGMEHRDFVSAAWMKTLVTAAAVAFIVSGAAIGNSYFSGMHTDGMVLMNDDIMEHTNWYRDAGQLQDNE